jgi:hypothetical protein
LLPASAIYFKAGAIFESDMYIIKEVKHSTKSYLSSNSKVENRKFKE